MCLISSPTRVHPSILIYRLDYPGKREQEKGGTYSVDLQLLTCTTSIGVGTEMAPNMCVLNSR
jgi:hypothetical protein